MQLDADVDAGGAAGDASSGRAPPLLAVAAGIWGSGEVAERCFYVIIDFLGIF
jgi:hypothetical protein